MHSAEMYLLSGTRGCGLRGAGVGIRHPGHGATLGDPGRRRLEAPAAAPVFTGGRPGVEAAGVSVLAVSVPAVTETKGGVLDTGHSAGFAGRAAAAFTAALPGTTEAGVAVHTRRLPKAAEQAAVVVSGSVLGVVSPAGQGVPDGPAGTGGPEAAVLPVRPRRAAGSAASDRT